MADYLFPPLTLESWRPTLDTLQNYAKFIGKVRRAFTPRQKHWSHVSLRVDARGVTTTAIPIPPDTFEMRLELTTHRLVVNTSRGDEWVTPLAGQSPAHFMEAGLAALAGFGIEPDIDQSLFASTNHGAYDTAAVSRFWLTLAQLDAIFKQFRGELRQETGPVQLWPHHFDLAMLWFSGRLVPGQDPENEEYADEQMNFGFVPGDESIDEPYFYITAYPVPDGFTNTRLTGDAYWLTEGFTGAIMPYAALVDSGNADQKLLDFFRTVQHAGAALMK